jgi:hypothetical protein
VREEAAQYKRERDAWALSVQRMEREQTELRALVSLADVAAIQRDAEAVREQTRALEAQVRPTAPLARAYSDVAVAPLARAYSDVAVAPLARAYSDVAVQQTWLCEQTNMVWQGVDREWPLNLSHRPHFRGVRVALGTGYNRVQRTGRAWRNGRVSSSRTRSLLLLLTGKRGEGAWGIEQVRELKSALGDTHVALTASTNSAAKNAEATHEELAAARSASHAAAKALAQVSCPSRGVCMGFGSSSGLPEERLGSAPPALTPTPHLDPQHTLCLNHGRMLRETLLTLAFKVVRSRAHRFQHLTVFPQPIPRVLTAAATTGVGCRMWQRCRRMRGHCERGAHRWTASCTRYAPRCLPTRIALTSSERASTLYAVGV